MTRRRLRWNPSPLTRIAAGIAALAVMVLMLLDVALGLVDDPPAREREARRTFAELLTVHASRLAANQDVDAVAALLADAVRRRGGLASAALVRSTGEPVASAGPHADAWAAAGDGIRSTSTHLRVPVLENGDRWGELQLAFAPIPGDSWPGILATPRAWWPIACFAVLFLLLRLYIAQVMRILDPSAQVPERVRQAYDALSEGIALLDEQGRTVLSNEAFRQMTGGQSPLPGRALQDNDWFRVGLGRPRRGEPAWPWQAALDGAAPTGGQPLVVHWGGQARHLVVRCSPLLDDGRRARGCLVVFLDRTAIERANEELRSAVDQLQAAQTRIEAQNAELVRLATRDPLSGCLNRRAFFEAAAKVQEGLRHTSRPYACVMTDIDHFKSFNDRYGHQIGDEVIKAVARLLQDGVRSGDLVCRYGGEEFCILIPNGDEALAMDLAEQLRATIAVRAGPSIAYREPLAVRSSFGVAVARADEPLEAVIDRADQALYVSKRAGRNRVTLFEADTAVVPADA